MRRIASLVTAAVVTFSGTAAVAQVQDSAPAGEGASSERSVVLSEQSVVLGDQITVRGGGWPANQVIGISVCGNLALRGSADCSQASSSTTVSTGDGAFVAQLRILAPPADCPCVVHTTATGAIGHVDLPIDIRDHPVSDVVRPARQAEPKAAVTVTEVSGSGPWTSWIGGSATRSVEIEIENTGPVPINGAQGLVKVGRSANPSTVAETFEINSLAPGESTTLVYSVDLPAPNFGGYWVTASVDGVPNRVVGAQSTSAWPWGLVLLILLALQWPVFKGRNWLRDRLADMSEASAGAAAPPAIAALPSPNAQSANDASVAPTSATDATPAATATAPPSPALLAATTATIAATNEPASVAPIPIVMATPSHVEVPVHFESVPPGQTPMVSIQFDSSHSDGVARLISVTVGGDIELRMRPVTPVPIDEYRGEVVAQ